MSLDLFCQKLFKIKEPEKVNIPFRIGMKGREATLEDVFRSLIVIFMYGLLEMRGGDDVILSEVTSMDIEEISRFMKVIGVVPIINVIPIGEIGLRTLDAESPQYLSNLSDYSLKHRTVNNIYVLKFNHYVRDRDISKKCHSLDKNLV